MLSTRLRESLDRRLGARSAQVVLLVLGFSIVEARVQAQGFGPDPFRPFNSQYDPYVFGVAPGALDPIGNATLNRAGVRNANQFRGGPAGMEDRGVGNRYDRAFRDFDSEYGRLYRPNAETDEKFDAQRDKVSDIYFQYLRERDPRKRAGLFKEYSQAQSRLSRDLASSPNSRNARRTPRTDGEDSPPPGLERGRRRPAADSTPPPGFSGDSVPPPPRSRRRSAASTPAAGPESNAPSPSEVLDRATRSDAPPVPSPRP